MGVDSPKGLPMHRIHQLWRKAPAPEVVFSVLGKVRARRRDRSNQSFFPFQGGLKMGISSETMGATSHRGRLGLAVKTRVLGAAFTLCAALVLCDHAAGAELKVDKEKHSVSIPCKVAPRKLPDLSEVYPLEVICTRTTGGDGKRAQKSHETVVVFDSKPSEVHQALESLGLKPGKPAQGEGAKAEGPEVEIYIETTKDGSTERHAIEKLIVDRKTGKAMPKLKWLFTGSVMSQPDPDKPKVYGADHSGTLIAIFPVTAETVFQTNLTMKEEKLIKLETNKKLLPAEGTEVALVIVAK